jgi:hypothetical protein
MVLFPFSIGDDNASIADLVEPLLWDAASYAPFGVRHISEISR